MLRPRYSNLAGGPIGVRLAFAAYYLVCVALTWLWFCRRGVERFRGV